MTDARTLHRDRSGASFPVIDAEHRVPLGEHIGSRSQASPGRAERPSGYLVAGVVFLFFSNTVGVMVRSHGAPPAVGLMLILLLGIPVLSLAARGKPLVVPSAFPFVGVYLVVQAVSTMLSSYPRDAIAVLQQFMVEGALLYLLVVNAVRNVATLVRLIWAVIAAGAVVASLSALQWITGTFDRPYGGFAVIPLEYLSGFAAEPRAAGPLGDPNYYAQMLLVPLTLSAVLVFTERRFLLKVLSFTALVLCMVGVVLTGSRGAGLAIVLTIALLMLLRAVRPRYVMFLVVGLVVVLAWAPAYRQRVLTVTSVLGGSPAEVSVEEDDSVGARATEMLAAGGAFADHPLVGLGPGVFPLEYQKYAKPVGMQIHEETKVGEQRGQTPEREAHNLFLGLAAETGAAGVGAFLGIIAVTLHGLLRARRRFRTLRPELANMATALLAAMVAYFAAGMFLALAFERFLWILLALGAVPALLSPDEQTMVPRETTLAGVQQ